MIKAKWWNKRKASYQGGSKPLLKKRRVPTNEKDVEETKKNKTKLKVVDEDVNDDTVIEVTNIEEEEIVNPVNELLSIFSEAKKKSIGKKKAIKAQISEENDNETNVTQDAKENAENAENADCTYRSDDDSDGDEYFEASEIPLNIENTFERHIESDNSKYVSKYSSLAQKSFDVKLPNLGPGFFEYRCPEDETELKQVKVKKSLMDFDLKQSLLDNLPKTIANFYDGDDPLPKLNGLQFDILSILHDYKDLLYCYRDGSNGEQIRLIYTLHCLNHVLKTRNKIIHHNTKLTQGKKKNAEYRDQGLTRPKVLIVVPFRESAFRTIDFLINLVSNDDDESERLNIMNHKRFKEEFESNESTIKPTKPQDYNELFAGNIDDSFRIGIAVTKKSLKLYADFYSCDIIVASPLGLRLIIGAEGEKERDFDFLSSIEILILDQADVFLMQNWEHVLDLMKHMNIQPNDSHGTDFSRVRMWALEGHSKYYRQTAIFSSTSCPQINSLFKNRCFNYEGRINIKKPVLPADDQLHLVFVKCPQSFYRFESDSITTSPDQRFDYFIKVVLPKCREMGEPHTMIFVPSYFDFVKLRNYFRTEDINFTQICEYSKSGKIAQSRAWFFHEGRSFLLYTERSHFFNRFRIKGIRHLVFYQLPTYPHFYSELTNLLHPSYQGKKFKGDEASVNCTVMFDKFDVIQLEKIVGTEKAAYLIKSENDNHVFISQAKRTIQI